MKFVKRITDRKLQYGVNREAANQNFHLEKMITMTILQVKNHHPRSQVEE